MQLSGINYIDIDEQPPPPSTCRTFSSSQAETLPPLSNNFPFFLCSASGNHHSTFCFHEFDYTAVPQIFPGGSIGKESTCQCRRYETLIPSLGQEDPLEEGMATHSSILAWRIPWTEEPGGLVHGVEKSWTRLKQLSKHARTVSQISGSMQYLSFGD